MARVIKVGVVFEFYPDTEHAELFENQTLDEIIANAKDMTTEDIHSLVKYNEVFENLSIEIKEIA